MWLPAKRVESTLSGMTYDVYRSDTGERFGPPWPMTVDDIKYDYLVETMATDKGSHYEHGWKGLTHYKRRTSLFPSRMTDSTNSGTQVYSWERLPYYPLQHAWGSPGDGTRPVTAFGSVECPIEGLPSVFVEDEGWNGQAYMGHVPLPSNLSDLVERSLQNMLPGIRPRLSLVNSVLELKDFKSLPQTFLRVSEAIRTLARSLRISSFNGSGRRTLRAIIRNAIVKPGSDSYLQYSFNLSPLFSDLSGIYQTIQSVRNQINWLLANEGKLLVTHYRCPLSTFTNADDVVTIDNSQIGSWYNGGRNYRRQVVYGSQMFNASLMYRYTIPEWQKQNMFLNGIMDSLGVNLNPAIIWNAVRWSFVIDWVLGIGRWLDQWKTRNIEPQTELRQYLFSVRYQRTVRCWYETNAGHAKTSGQVLTHVVDECAYHRALAKPDMYRSIELSGLNPKEFSLGAALLASR